MDSIEEKTLYRSDQSFICGAETFAKKRAQVLHDNHADVIVFLEQIKQVRFVEFQEDGGFQGDGGCGTDKIREDGELPKDLIGFDESQNKKLVVVRGVFYGDLHQTLPDNINLVAQVASPENIFIGCNIENTTQTFDNGKFIIC